MWQARSKLALLLFVAIVAAAPVALAQPTDESSATVLQPTLGVREIVSRLEARNQERADALRAFQGTRLYRITYRGFFGNRDAEMTVKLAYTSPSSREFTVVSQSGSTFLCDHIFKGLLDGEKEAMTDENRKRTALNSENYNFTLVGRDGRSDDAPYVLNVEPKGDNKYLYRGTIWVDAKDFAVTRVQAEPAKNPSFWLKKTVITHRYEKVGDFWLPSADDSESAIRLGGRAQLTIEYTDYEITASARPDSLPASPTR